MSCPTNCVSASWPCTAFTRNWSLMCILLKSPVRSWTVTSVTRPTSLSGVSVGVSPSSCLLNISGASRLYHTFAFHLSLILRAAARDFFSAMRAACRGVAYLRVGGGTSPRSPPRPRDQQADCHPDPDEKEGRQSMNGSIETEHARVDVDPSRSFSEVPGKVQRSDSNLVHSVRQRQRDDRRESDRLPRSGVYPQVESHEPRGGVGCGPCDLHARIDAGGRHGQGGDHRRRRVHADSEVAQGLAEPCGIRRLELDGVLAVREREWTGVRRPRAAVDTIRDRRTRSGRVELDPDIRGVPSVRTRGSLQCDGRRGRNPANPEHSASDGLGISGAIHGVVLQRMRAAVGNRAGVGQPVTRVDPVERRGDAASRIGPLNVTTAPSGYRAPRAGGTPSTRRVVAGGTVSTRIDRVERSTFPAWSMDLTLRL